MGFAVLHSARQQLDRRVLAAITLTDQVRSALVNSKTRNVTPQEAELERMQGIEKSLRAEYILSHSDIRAGMLNGTEPLPVDWANERLKQMGETWRINPNLSRRLPEGVTTPPTTSKPLFTGNLKQRAINLSDEIRISVPHWKQSYNYLSDLPLQTRERARGTSNWFRWKFLGDIRKVHDEFAALHIRDAILDRFVESENNSERLREDVASMQQIGIPADVPEPWELNDLDFENIANALTAMAGNLP